MKPTSISFSKKYTLDTHSLSSLPFCPIFDEESIYSWCARIHRLIGQANALKTCHLLFKHNNAGLHHDFPRRLSSLIKNTGQSCNPETFLTVHTALGSYKAFLAKEKFNESVASALIGRHADIKTLLGGHNSGVLYPFALKYCPECVSCSLQDSGYSIWKTIHQWPSVHICTLHSRLLISAPKGFHNKPLKKWYLPHDDFVSQWSEQKEVTERALDILLKICNWSMFLTKYNDHPLDSYLLRALYHLQARNHGFVASDGLLNFQQFKKAFIYQYQDISSIKGFEFLGEVDKDHGGMLGVIFKQYSGDRLPLKQMLMIDFLFESPANFSKSYHLIQRIRN